MDDATQARPRFTRFEIGEVALIAVAIGATFFLSGDLDWSPQLRWLFGYCAALILGHKSGEIEALLGYRGRVEMIHRNDLVLASHMRNEQS